MVIRLCDRESTIETSRIIGDRIPFNRTFLYCGHNLESLLHLRVLTLGEHGQIEIHIDVGSDASSLDARPSPRVPTGNRHSEVVSVTYAKVGAAQNLTSRSIAYQDSKVILLCERCDHLSRAVTELID